MYMCLIWMNISNFDFLQVSFICKLYLSLFATLFLITHKIFVLYMSYCTDLHMSTMECTTKISTILQVVFTLQPYLLSLLHLCQ